MAFSSMDMRAELAALPSTMEGLAYLMAAWATPPAPSQSGHTCSRDAIKHVAPTWCPLLQVPAPQGTSWVYESLPPDPRSATKHGCAQLATILLPAVAAIP